MNRSDTHILTTHAGALPRPDDLLELNAQAASAQQSGQPFDERTHRERLHSAVTDVVQKQAELGISVVNDGEYGKAMRTRLDYGAWLSYVMQRLTGWEPAPAGADGAPARAEEGVAPRGF